MRRFLALALLPPALAAQNLPLVREAAASFAAPPAEYGLLDWWGWSGPMTEQVILRDLDARKANHITGVLIGPGRGLEPRYLTPAYFERVRFAVEEARRRSMVLWIADEGSYPSGIAGGKFNTERPDLRMQGVVAAERIDAPPGQTVSRKLAPETLGALAVNLADKRSLLLETSSGELNWRAPEGRWQVLVVQHQFRTSPTRYIYHPTGAKDTTYSLFDYLNPEATRQFLAFVHEEYKKYVGAEFGRTVRGFFGDEPDYAHLPWTPALLGEFERRKGYDVRPYLVQFFAPVPSEEVKRAKADYWDVWTDLYRDNFIKPQADWCARNNLQYTVHLNHEDEMMRLVRSQGDFFKAMRYVPVPAIDAIWRQIWLDKVADFPKLASSAAHLWGRPRVFSESFAVYGRGLSVEQAKWVIDHQLVRGVNLFLTSIFGGRGASNNPQAVYFPAAVSYANRASYLLSLGRPAAAIALYHPTSSLWLGDEEPNTSVLALARQLLESQRDFDFIDEQTLAAGVPKAYHAVVVPSATVISRAALAQLRTFAKSGGRVIFAGRAPLLVVDRTFLKSEAAPAVDWAERSLDALPRGDVSLDDPCPALKYVHRRWRDADLYFFFNESAEHVSRTASLAGRGRLQVWDAEDGSIGALAGSLASVPLVLEPYGTRFLVIGPLPPGAGPAEPLLGPAGTLAVLAGDWTVEIGGKTLTTGLKPWAELGFPSYSGAARYRKEFTAPAATGARVFLECAEVHYSARAWLNGVDLGPRPWRPFRWEITKALKPGANLLEIEVRNTPAAAFAGDPARQAQLKQEATKGGYLAISLKFDLEMLPSGLLGPVRIAAFRNRATPAVGPARAPRARTVTGPLSADVLHHFPKRHAGLLGGAGQGELADRVLARVVVQLLRHDAFTPGAARRADPTAPRAAPARCSRPARPEPTRQVRKQR